MRPYHGLDGCEESVRRKRGLRWSEGCSFAGGDAVASALELIREGDDNGARFVRLGEHHREERVKWRGAGLAWPSQRARARRGVTWPGMLATRWLKGRDGRLERGVNSPF
jgi:hypothetical protein